MAGKRRQQSNERRAVGYFRVSSKPQAGDDRHSLPIQRECFSRYCLDHDLLPLRTYVDVMTGRRDDRDEYQRMLGDAARGEFDTVIVQYLDRFGRDSEEIAYRVLHLKREYGISVACTDEPITDFIHLAFSSYKAGEEVSRNAERVRNAMIRVVASGKNWGKTPFGFTKTADRLLVLNESEASMIRAAASLILDDNLSLFQTAEELNRRGYSRRGAPWTTIKVRWILLAPNTGGKTTFGRTTNARDAFTRDAAFPAILTTQQQEAIAERLASRAELHKGYSLSSEFVLSGLLFCGLCGRRMHGGGGPRYKRIRYYRCSAELPDNSKCSFNYQRAPELETAVFAQLSEYANADLARQVETPAIPDYKAEIREIEAELKRIDADFLKAFRAFTSGLLADEDQYRLANQELKARQSALKNRLADVESREHAAGRAAVQAAQFPAMLRSFLETYEALPIQQRKARLSEIITKVLVMPDHSFTIITPIH